MLYMQTAVNAVQCSILAHMPSAKFSYPTSVTSCRSLALLLPCSSSPVGTTSMAQEGASLGKGAWDCDTNTEIPPQKEAEVFEEIATMEYPFEGIPTVPPRKDVDHMAFFCNGCRYRVTARTDWTVAKVKQALWEGGISRSNKPPERSNTPGLQRWEDLELLYAMQRMADDKLLSEYHVPPGCKTMIAIERAKLDSGVPDPDSAYWN